MHRQPLELVILELGILGVYVDKVRVPPFDACVNSGFEPLSVSGSKRRSYTYEKEWQAFGFGVLVP